MSDDHLYDLVIEWDRQRQLGQAVSPETLCADQPELLDDLRDRIESVKETDWLFVDEEDTNDSFLSLPDFTRQADLRPRPGRRLERVATLLRMAWICSSACRCSSASCTICNRCSRETGTPNTRVRSRATDRQGLPPRGDHVWFRQ